MQIWVGLGRRKWRRKWHPIPLFLLRQSHGQRSLAGYSPWGHRESHTTELTHIYIVYPQTEPQAQEILSISKFYNLMRERSTSDTPQKYKGIVDISLEISVDSRVYCINGVLTPQMQAHQCQAAEHEFVLRLMYPFLQIGSNITSHKLDTLFSECLSLRDRFRVYEL